MHNHAKPLIHPDHDTDGGQASCRRVAKLEKKRKSFFERSHCRQSFNDDILLQQEKSSSDNKKRKTDRNCPANKNSQMPKYTVIRLPHLIKEKHHSDSRRREKSTYFERSSSCSTSGVASIDKNKNGKRSTTTNRNFNSNNNSNNDATNSGTFKQEKTQNTTGRQLIRPLADVVIWKPAKDDAESKKKVRKLNLSQMTTQIKNYLCKFCDSVRVLLANAHRVQGSKVMNCETFGDDGKAFIAKCGLTFLNAERNILGFSSKEA